MKVMVVGEFCWPWYQEIFSKALYKNNCDVINFSWFDYFYIWKAGKSEPVYKSLFHRIQYRLRKGPIVNDIGKNLLRDCISKKPDVIFFYNVLLIPPNIIIKIKEALPQTQLCQYANDDPFTKNAKIFLWDHFLNSIKYFDKHYAYRKANIKEFYKYGAKEVELLRSYFIPEEDYPMDKNQIKEKYKCDVLFAGHYEDDSRVEFLESIIDSGFTLNLFGGGWDAALPKLRKDSPLRSKFPISPVTGDEYRQAICGSKLALCFLSKLNNDTYTRRNFQIPAMRTCMLSEYTSDLANMFLEDEEVLFFKTKDEMLKKISLVIKNPGLRDKIANNGYKRVYQDGHDVYERAKSFLKSLN